MKSKQAKSWILGVLGFAFLVAACTVHGELREAQYAWWRGQGPVVPHESFPADCKLCHVGENWNDLKKSFRFDHAKETGVELRGAHKQAQCLRCHNDRGPVDLFQARGCGGCHEDVHLAQLGPDCTKCHQEETWQPIGQLEMHNSTRFPLVGVHAATACRRCHVGAEVGRFRPVDVECLTCHRADLARANNPNHLGLGWVDRCDRCHLPTDWNQAEIDR